MATETGFMTTVVGGVTQIASHPAIGQMQERTVTHWSIRLQQVMTVASGVWAIVALATQNYVKGVILLIAALSYWAGFYHLQEFVPMNSIEEDTDKLRRLLQQLDGLNVELGEAVTSAGEVVTLAGDVDDEILTHHEFGIDLVQRLIPQLEEKTEQLHAAQEALRQFESLFERVEAARLQTAREIANFAGEERDLESMVVGVEVLSDAMTTAIDEIPDDIVDRLALNEEAIIELHRRHETLTEFIREQTLQLDQILVPIADRLRDNVDNLRAVDQSVASSTATVRRQVDRLGNLSLAIQQELDTTEKFLDRNYILGVVRELTAQNQRLKNRIRELEDG